jgi:hypothetical protein
MTLKEAAHILAQRYRSAEFGKNKALSIHLFAIEFAEQISHLSIAELVRSADIPHSYQVEINKGINLAAHVKLR